MSPDSRCPSHFRVSVCDSGLSIGDALLARLLFAVFPDDVKIAKSSKDSRHSDLRSSALPIFDSSKSSNQYFVSFASFSTIAILFLGRPATNLIIWSAKVFVRVPSSFLFMIYPFCGSSLFFVSLVSCFHFRDSRFDFRVVLVTSAHIHQALA
jgi:hypothetical protein